jgi:uncharacterized membrane protein YqjE
LSVDRAGRDPRPGLAAAIRQLLHGAAEIGRTRLELALLELEAERRRLARILVRLAVGLVLVVFALALVVVGWLLHLPAQDRAIWALALAGAFGVAALLGAWDGRRLARRRRPLLSTRWMPPPRPPGE